MESSACPLRPRFWPHSGSPFHRPAAPRVEVRGPPPRRYHAGTPSPAGPLVSRSHAGVGRMPGFTPFTSNYQDLSNDQGYQFEFRCDVCGSGYRSQFIRNNLGMGASILNGASSVFGGRFWGASNAANAAQNITDRGARDKALETASYTH